MVTGIELFAGAGGLALGLEAAGIQSVGLVENNADAAQTLRTNRPGWNVIQSDIRHVDFTPWRGRVDIVSGGFPCQPFSYKGLKLGFTDTRGTLFYEFARCVNEVEPAVILAENVRGLLAHDGGKTLETIKGVFAELGYEMYVKLVRAMYLDVPQKRERVVMLGLRKGLGLTPRFPAEDGRIITLREALKDVPDSPGVSYPARKAEVMALVPAGGYWRDLPPEIQREYMKKSYYLGGGKTGMARRLDWDSPSLTLLTNPSQNQTERCHPSETRPLRIREYARIQTFPDEWQFSGSLMSQYRQIGNAVPVRMGEHIGNSLLEILGA